MKDSFKCFIGCNLVFIFVGNSIYLFNKNHIEILPKKLLVHTKMTYLTKSSGDFINVNKHITKIIFTIKLRIVTDLKFSTPLKKPTYFYSRTNYC